MIKDNFNKKNLLLKGELKEQRCQAQSPSKEEKQGQLYDLVTYILCILGIVWVFTLISGTFNSLPISIALDFIAKD